MVPTIPGRRRRAPTAADLVVLAVLAAAVPLARRAAALPHDSSLLLLRAGAEPARVVDARRDADVDVVGPLGRTVVRVRHGEVWIESAPCRNHLCQRMGRLRGPGRSLVCVPNRVVVRFAPAGSGGVDTITR